MMRILGMGTRVMLIAIIMIVAVGRIDINGGCNDNVNRKKKLNKR